MKRILISGGAGFIGSHLCERFVRQGHQVICADNLLTGSLKNITHLQSLKNFRFIRRDVSKPFALAGKLDWILHMASPASPPDYLRLPFETLKVGSFGTYHLLELAHRKRATFLMASTSEVYGDPLVHPQPERYWGNVNPIGRRAVYDEAKRFSEAMTMAYRRERGVDTRIIRIFNTYGPRMRVEDGRVVPNFICQALSNKPLTVYGSGKQTRSYCYVEDLVTGIEKVMRGRLAGPVNLGNPNEKSVAMLARLILQLTGSKSRLVFKPLPEDDPKVRKPDITLARKTLRWEPRVDLKTGLLATIRDFKARLSSR